MTEETILGTDIHTTLGFLTGVLKSAQITGRNLSDPEDALKRILEDVDRGLNQYELYEKARKSKYGSQIQ